MSKGTLTLAMEGLTLLVIPLVHRTGLIFGGGGGGPSEVEIRFKGCLPDGRGKTSILRGGLLKG